MIEDEDFRIAARSTEEWYAARAVHYRRLAARAARDVAEDAFWRVAWDGCDDDALLQVARRLAAAVREEIAACLDVPAPGTGASGAGAALAG